MADYILTIVFVFPIAVFQTYATDAASCCTKPDIHLTVDCTTTPGLIQLQWDSDVTSLWGFCINYDCKLPTDGDYCDSYEKQECFNYFDKSQSHSKTIEELGIPDNGSCWFWAKNQDLFEIDEDDRGCSKLTSCNVNLSPVSSSTEASTNNLPHTSSVSLLTSLVPLSATSTIVSNEIPISTESVHLPLSILSSSSSLTSLPFLASQLSVTVSVESTSDYLTVSTISEPISVTTKQPRMITETMTSSVTPLLSQTPLSRQTPLSSPTPTPLHSQASKTTTTQNKISFFATFSCIIIVVTFILTICLFMYWNKRKQQKLEIAIKIRIEKECYIDIVDIAKESDSDIEIVIDHGKEDDVISITEDDVYMYNKILYPWQKQQAEILQQPTPLTLSQLSILTESDTDDGSVRLSNDYYCAKNGSAGDCLKSNTSSSQTNSISSIPATVAANV